MDIQTYLSELSALAVRLGDYAIRIRDATSYATDASNQTSAFPNDPNAGQCCGALLDAIADGESAYQSVIAAQRTIEDYINEVRS